MMKLQPSSAWYALRRPLPPWRFDELLAEMVEQLPHYRVDEVILMVDVEEFFHNHPTPAVTAEFSKNLVHAREALAQIGVAYSLNPWITRGHEDRGRNAADALPGIQTVVHADGSQATCVACNLSAIWQENLRRVWSIYAATKPRVLWIDDDIRDFGAHECFCPLHLERFSRRVGKNVTRAELIEAILKPDEPHPWRTEWLAIHAEASLDVMRLITATAHAASPHTRMGLMSSGPRNHCRESRDWIRVAETLGATMDRPIFSRPTMGNYWEWGPPHGLYFSADSIKLTRHCLPLETVDYTELESVPFSRFSKSVAFTFAQLAVSFAFGVRGATLDIFDFIGTPMEAEPHYGRLLGTRKDFLNALAGKAQRPGNFRGVRLLYKKDAAVTKRLGPGDGTAALAGEGYPALEAFEAAGIPTTYDESEVVFLCGQQPRALSDDEIRTLLVKGLFLDATAASVLCERGFGADIGLNQIASPERLEKLGAFSVEDFSNMEFGGKPRQFMTAQLPMVDYSGRFAVMQPDERSAIIGHLLDPDTRPVHPAMFAFENSRGGRVVVHAWDYASAIGPIGVSFHNPVRQRQLQNIVRWLFRNRAPLLIRGDGAWPLALRKDCGNETLVGLLNLSLDAWPGVEFEMAAPAAIAEISLVEPDGVWTPLDEPASEIRDGVLRLMIARPVALESPLFVNIKWNQAAKPPLLAT
jgi:hypothetical protein